MHPAASPRPSRGFPFIGNQADVADGARYCREVAGARARARTPASDATRVENKGGSVYTVERLYLVTQLNVVRGRARDDTMLSLSLSLLYFLRLSLPLSH